MHNNEYNKSHNQDPGINNSRVKFVTVDKNKESLQQNYLDSFSHFLFLQTSGQWRAHSWIKKQQPNLLPKRLWL